jgi:hypothetical protein
MCGSDPSLSVNAFLLCFLLDLPASSEQRGYKWMLRPNKNHPSLRAYIEQHDITTHPLVYQNIVNMRGKGEMLFFQREVDKI